MKKLTILAVLALVGLWLETGVAFAEEWKGKSETKNAGSYMVELITPADGVKIGANNVAVQLKDSSTGQPVSRDSVSVDFLMDEGDTSMGHGGMNMSTQKPVAVDLKAVSGVAGRYEGKAQLTYSGDWKVRVYADPKGLQPPATFTVNVAAAGPNFGVIGGIVVAIVAAVGGIVFMMRRSKTTPSSATVSEAGEA